MSAVQGSRIQGVVAMGGCAFLWSLAGLFIKVIDWNPFAICGARSLIAALFLLIVLKKPRFSFSAPQILAALANTATMMLFIYANKATTSANAILLQYGCPIYAAILGSLVLKEKPKAEQWGALGFVVIGMVFLFSGSIGGGSLLGNLAAAAAGLTFAFYTVFLRQQKNSSPLESILLSHFLTSAICLFICFFMPAPRFSLPAVAGVLGLGILQMGLSSLLLSFAVKHITALEVNILDVIEPVLNPLWVFLVTGEEPGARAIVGGAIIIIAVVAATCLSFSREGRTAGTAAVVLGTQVRGQGKQQKEEEPAVY